MNIFSGSVWASHQNCRTLVPGERQFSDKQLKCIIERGGIIGGALDTWMLDANFEMSKHLPEDLDIKWKSWSIILITFVSLQGIVCMSVLGPTSTVCLAQSKRLTI